MYCGCTGQRDGHNAGRKEQDEKTFHHDDWLSLAALGPGNMIRGCKGMRKGQTGRHSQNRGLTAATRNFQDDRYNTRTGPASLGRRCL